MVLGGFEEWGKTLRERERAIEREREKEETRVFMIISKFLQMLQITVDESDVFSAWVSAKDAGINDSDNKGERLAYREKEREIERERKRQRQREGERDRERGREGETLSPAPFSELRWNAPPRPI